MKAITQLAATYPFQSYFDNALLLNAILSQSIGNQIVNSTRQFAQTPGEGVALHPSSRSPVAIKFHGGDADSAVIHLTPGQKVFPGSFKHIEWGLPFGWLGGGTVILYVLNSKEADIEFPAANVPVVFHRQRCLIVNGNSVAAPGTPNWPMAFPWSNANRSVAGALTPQQASPLFGMVPDVTLLQYNGALAAPLDLNIQFTNITSLDQNSPPDQAVGYANGIHFWPVTIPAVIGPNVASLVWLPPEVGHFAGDACAVTFLDPAGVAGGAFIDVVRYGRFM